MELVDPNDYADSVISQAERGDPEQARKEVLGVLIRELENSEGNPQAWVNAVVRNLAEYLVP